MHELLKEKIEEVTKEIFEALRREGVESVVSVALVVTLYRPEKGEVEKVGTVAGGLTVEIAE
jgi:hypothetical protein